MTRKELNWRLGAINARRISEARFQAGLAGRELQGDPEAQSKETPSKPKEFTKDELARIEKARKETFAKKVRELRNG